MTSVGRMLMVGLEGRKVTPAHRLFLKESGAGGVILFARNYENPKQLSRFIADLREAASGPLIVGVDQEGGRVSRFGAPFTALPPMARLGEAGEEAEAIAEDVGAMLGRELAAVGMDVDFAPVLDVATNPKNPVIGDRAISAEPSVVASLGVAFIRGMQSQGVAACAKHFPGHGVTDRDSHVEMPDASLSREEMKPHLAPFEAVIEADVATMMTAHIRCKAIDPYHQATLSGEFLSIMLRGEMGYRGVVITDDLGMAGVAELMPAEDAAMLALRAGADMLLIAHDLQLAGKLRHSIDEAVRHLLLSPDDIMDKIERVGELRKKFKVGDNSPGLKVIGCGEHQSLARGK